MRFSSFRKSHFYFQFMRYFLIGYKSSGKTTLGKQLAEKLNLSFIDLDDVIEEMEGKSVPEIYTLKGEEKFRHKEWKALNKVIENNNVVVSTGGGAPCHCDNMNLMLEHGKVIYLKVNDEVLVKRLAIAAKDRPIVRGKSEEELHQYVSDLKNRCEHHYMRAKCIVEGGDLTVEDIIEKINANGN